MSIRQELSRIYPNIFPSGVRCPLPAGHPALPGSVFPAVSSRNSLYITT